MQRIGIAMSGGGFRATLFHLGLVRFFRDAEILPRVTHITSVSGGSILAAHLVLNWDRYCGTPEQFDAAASEVLDFVRLDVRNRIVRRYPFSIPARWISRLLLIGPSRRHTRTGWLETYYRRHLYGDTSLSELPENPQLHLLSTNLSEGGLSSFTRRGLILQRRLPNGSCRFDAVRADLATVPMAVATSSAFPGFFPPMVLSGSDIGAVDGEFSRQSFTDGGVFDNLGIRAFRFIERSWIGRDFQLRDEDFLDIQAVMEVLRRTLSTDIDTPTRHIAQLLASRARTEPHDSVKFADDPEQFVKQLSALMVDAKLYREPLLQSLTLESPDAQSLFELARRSDEELGSNDHVWINRQILSAAFRQATGKPCLRPFAAGLDGVIVSDADRGFKIASDSTTSTVIGTALRSSDILMDRVAQLEREVFENTPGFVFVRATDTVSPEEDPSALPTKMQRRAAKIRTDLDRFSPLEISGLVQHGYCVARKICKAHPDLFGSELPSSPPWNPVDVTTPTSHSQEGEGAVSDGRELGPSNTTKLTRQLFASSGRRIWSTMLDYRDWISYVYVPLIVPLLFLGPYLGWKYYQRMQVAEQFMDAISESTPGFAVLQELLEAGPVAPWEPAPIEEVAELPPPNYAGFEIVMDARFFDLRLWESRSDQEQTNSRTHVTWRLRIRKDFEQTTDPVFPVQFSSESSKIDFRCLNDNLRPVFSRCETVSPETQESRYLWECKLDFSHVPAGDLVDVWLEAMFYEGFQGRKNDDSWLAVPVKYGVGGISIAAIFPSDKPFKTYRVVRHDELSSGRVTTIEPALRFPDRNGTVLGFVVLGPEPGSNYECHWSWRE